MTIDHDRDGQLTAEPGPLMKTALGIIAALVVASVTASVANFATTSVLVSQMRDVRADVRTLWQREMQSMDARLQNVEDRP